MNDEELLRFSRHIMMPSVDVSGQKSICDGRALIIGLGGLGSPAAMYLAASGVGQLVLVDDDDVDVSNLQRQIIHREASIGTPKVESAQESIQALAGACKVTAICRRLDDKQLSLEIEAADVVLDCSDNFPTRQQINQTCFQLRTPLISGAAIRMEGQISVFDFRDEDSPCYRCLYDLDEQQLTCSESGILSPVVGVIGAMQAVEALKVLAGTGELMMGRLALYDAASGQWRQLRLRKDPQCSICSDTKAVGINEDTI